jgi:hypothetical protein
VRVDHRGAHILVAHQLLDGATTAHKIGLRWMSQVALPTPRCRRSSPGSRFRSVASKTQVAGGTSARRTEGGGRAPGCSERSVASAGTRRGRSGRGA